MRSRFLEAILSADGAKAGRTGAPERSTARWLVERWEALRLALGAHGALPCEVGPLIRLQGVPNATPLAPPTAPPPSRGSREGNSKPRTHGVARTRKCVPSFRGACALAQANPESRRL